MVSEAKAIAALVCGTSHSGFKSRLTPLKEDAAKWWATGLENRGGLTPSGSIPPSSAFHLKPKSEALC
ncbi:hypothetical protein NOS3756_19950 [Nostoc sp. NIES-3756]|nr:hypothetical protein NOS3756_19950 [Nostoc sp. NIES-3756]